MGILAGRGFGLLIAYVVPGFIALIGISTVSPAVADWLFGAGENGPTIGGVVYLLIASVSAGMTASAFRWFVLDRFHAWRGLKRPDWDDSDLWRRQQAYELLIEAHYRYYQFYGNTTVALVFAWTLAVAFGHAVPLWTGFGTIAVSAVFIAASKDALSQYFRRGHNLLSSHRSSRNDQWRSSRRRVNARKRQTDTQRTEEAGEAQHQHAGRTEGTDPGPDDR